MVVTATFYLYFFFKKKKELGGFCNIVVFSTLFGGLRGGTFTYASALVSRQIKLDLFRSLIKQEIAFFDTTKSGSPDFLFLKCCDRLFEGLLAGETVSRLSSDCQVMATNVSTHVNVFLRNFVMFVGSLCMMLYMSWRLTMVGSCPILRLFSCEPHLSAFSEMLVRAGRSRSPSLLFLSLALLRSGMEVTMM